MSTNAKRQLKPYGRAKDLPLTNVDTLSSMPRVKHAPDLKLFNPKARRPPPSWVGDMESWGQESPALADSLAARLLPRRKGNQAILRTHPYLCGRLRSLREVRCHHTIFGLPETSHRLMLMASRLERSTALRRRLTSPRMPLIRLATIPCLAVVLLKLGAHKERGSVPTGYRS